jgi:hypothetical protein
VAGRGKMRRRRCMVKRFFKLGIGKNVVGSEGVTMCPPRFGPRT